MSEIPDPTETQLAGPFANETGLAVAFVDERSSEIRTENDNSICRVLNPVGEFSPDCARYCGQAYDRTQSSQKMIGYVCHAGLECRAFPFETKNRKMTAIVGRAFSTSDNYRDAADRAASGDWSELPVSRLFENILLAASPIELTAAAKRLRRLIRESLPDQTESEAVTVPTPVDTATPAATEPADISSDVKGSAAVWRSLFGSLLERDRATALHSILDFVADRYQLTDAIWMDVRGGTLVSTASRSGGAGRAIRLGISSEDERLLDAHRKETSLQISERKAEGRAGRTMNVFPVVVGSRVTSVLALIEPIDHDETRTRIARFCNSLGPQLEILRLRDEVLKADRLVAAARRFGDELAAADADDVWTTLAQSAAESLRAERVSLLAIDQKTGDLDIKAMIGAPRSVDEMSSVGERVARHILQKGTPVAVADVSRLGLPATERPYRTSSFLSCPITIGGRTLGVMNFTDRASGEAFDEESVELYRSIAPQLAVAVDRAALKEKAGEFEQLSVTDALTGLLNRRYIVERLQEEIKRSTRHGYPMSLMMLDVDQFKSYNDSFGHPAGDQALILVGSVIRDTLRSADVAARFGGEEFSILLPQTTADEALMIAERIRHNIEATKFGHREVTVSIGVASCSAELCVSADLVSAADQALYRAKRTGRNRVLAYDTVGAEIQMTGVQP